LNNRVKLLELIADNVTAILGYWDKNLINKYANRAYLEWFGYTKEQMVDIHLEEMLGEDYFEINKPRVDAVLNGEKQQFERCIKDRNGYDRWMLATYYPHIEEGEVLGFIAHVADITSVKLLQLELKHSKEIIEKQNIELKEFAGGVSKILTDLKK